MIPSDGFASKRSKERTLKFSFLKKLINGEKFSRAEKSLVKVTTILGIGGFTLGYDLGVVSGGLSSVSDRFSLSVYQSGFFVAAMSLGTVFGCLFGGIMSDTIGRWWTCQCQSFLFFIGSLTIALGQRYVGLVVGRIIIGIAAALAIVASVPYLKEVSPSTYRGRFQGAFEISVSLGILISSVFNTIAYNYGISWRLVYGFPSLLVLLQSVLLFLIPESPSFLSQKGRLEEASKALERIYNDPEFVENESYTLRLENMRKSSGAFLTFYYITKQYRITLGLVIFLVLFQSIGGGFIFPIYSSTIFQTVGFSKFTSLWYVVILGVVRLIVTVLAVFRIDTLSWGRRQLLLRGIFITVIGYIGLVLAYGFNDNVSKYFYLLQISIVVFGYGLSLGVVTRILQSELFPTIIRSRTMAISTLFQNLFQFFILYLLPRASDATSYGIIFVFFLLFTVIAFAFVYYFVPESVSRTPDQVLKLIEDRVNIYCKCCTSLRASTSLSDGLVTDTSSTHNEEFSVLHSNFDIPILIEKYAPPAYSDAVKHSPQVVVKNSKAKRGSEEKPHLVSIDVHKQRDFENNDFFIS